jgi:hypothetical protein
MADWYFNTPTTQEAPFAWVVPLDRYSIDRGITVYEISPGVYETGRYLSYTDLNALIAQGLAVYTGGHTYVVDDATRTALIAGASGVTAANFTPV